MLHRNLSHQPLNGLPPSQLICALAQLRDTLLSWTRSLLETVMKLRADIVAVVLAGSFRGSHASWRQRLRTWAALCVGLGYVFSWIFRAPGVAPTPRLDVVPVRNAAWLLVLRAAGGVIMGGCGNCAKGSICAV